MAQRIIGAINEPEGLKGANPTEDELINVLYEHDEKARNEAIEILEIIATEVTPRGK